MTSDLTLTSNFSVSASNTWKLNKNLDPDRGAQRLWLSHKFSDPSGYKFQIKIVAITFGFPSGRTSEISQVVLINCKMRKVRVDNFEMKVSRPGKKSVVAELTDLDLRRNGVSLSGAGITFDKNLFEAPTEIWVKVTIAQPVPANLKDDLHRQLNKELVDPIFADTILEIGDKELSCHGFMLAARSKVFNACLTQTGFVEGTSRRIKMDDTSVDAVTQLLNFIYTDAFDADDDNIYDLFVAADKYDIPGLKDRCRDLLMEDLDVSSATDCFRLAYLSRCQELLEKSLKIIAENLDEVKATEGWKSLANEEMQQILDQVQSMKSTGSIQALLETIKL